MTKLRDIYLFSPYYMSENYERQQEIDKCLKRNVDVINIKKIFLLIDDDSIPVIQNPKIEVLYIDKRPTYRDWIEYTEKYVKDGISVLANSDIYFDESVSNLNFIFDQNTKSFVAISRYEVIGETNTLHPNPHWSQDVWCIDSSAEITKILKKDLDISLGVPRCDNKIAYLFSVHGFDVFNPCKFVKTYHLHETQIRSYSAHVDKRILGGTAWVYASETLTDKAKLVFDVWSLSPTGNVEKIKMNDTILQKENNKKLMNEEQKNQIEKDPPFILSYDNEWQFPAITEQHAYEMLKKWTKGSSGIDSVIYFAFPWATLFDNLLHNKKNLERTHYLKNKLTSFKSRLNGKKRIITTCQHIHMLKFQSIFKEMGVTDIFWSHAVKGMQYLPDHPHIKVHPFPLYPVQAFDAVKIKNEKKKYVYSFMGAKANQYYLTNTRNIIIDELSKNKTGLVIGNDTWHYNKIVYDYQIQSKAKNKEGLVDDASSNKFKQVLEQSVFSLCPSGTGPNSIRLWESIGLGAIPVILADTLQLPGNQALWQQAVVFCKEDKESILNLPAMLKEIHANAAKLKEMRHAMQQIWDLYGAPYFVYDIVQLLLTYTQSALLNESQLKFGNSTSLEITLLTNEILLDTEKFVVRMKKDKELIKRSLQNASPLQVELFEKALTLKGFFESWSKH
ncbi:exostosin family protein [Acinetobacter sp. VNH17]|uniref:Exostosin family protein n=1 Tax=Acinetobacter thutiue TaxID=2998078 RepID=A0ABT7WS92_9GAMM|nr:exostosin family protein [Acinetobacter thutiue]MCY6413455.1 exostosin family protein [Acinetobacter thutiue]MDN0015564.1 exostosin family protein [Acinetobacter thutiue]